MATLLLHRPYDGRGMLRRLRVDVDGREIAPLEQGESVAVSVAVEAHSVVGRMDGTSSPVLEVEVAEDDELRVEVALPFSASWNMIWRPRSALTIKRL